MKKDLLAKQSRKEERIGLFGGTFNPIHLGHLRGAEEIREAFGLSQVIFIPAALPPHKEKENVLEADHRMEMVRLAIASNPYFSTSEIELKREGKSYTIDTLRYFREKYQNPLFFILGRDAFVEIETWKDFRELFSLSNFIIMTRPGGQPMLSSSPLPKTLIPLFRYDPKREGWLHPSGHALYFKEISYLEISSTKIRELIERGESVKYLIPPEVESYVREKGLYQKGR